MAAPWQNNWELFVDALQECLRKSEAEDVLAEHFGGKTVTWEGVLDEKNIDEQAAMVNIALEAKRIDFEGGRSAVLDGICLPVSDQSIVDWENLEIGTHVRFSATLGSRLSVFPPIEVKHLKTGESVIMIGLKDGVFVEKQSQPEK